MNETYGMNPDDHPAVSANDVKEVVAFGRKCAQGAFPNPTRAGCPDRARLRAMAQRDPGLALTDLPIAHVVHCSPCFHDYLRLRRACVLVRWFRVATASLIFATVFATAVLLVMNRTVHRNESAQSQDIQSGPKLSRDQGNPKAPVQTLPVEMTVDLAAYSPTRGDEDRLVKPIRLPQRRLHITFQMPLGMEAGEYVFELKDSSGAVLVHTNALGSIIDGTTSVNVSLDLADASRGNATLMIRPPGLSWRSFPSIIE
jgi:hypothetical protein